MEKATSGGGQGSVDQVPDGVGLDVESAARARELSAQNYRLAELRRQAIPVGFRLL